MSVDKPSDYADRQTEAAAVYAAIEANKSSDSWEYTLSKEWWEAWQTWVEKDSKGSTSSPGALQMKSLDLTAVTRKTRPPLCFEMKSTESGESEVGLHPGDIIDISHYDLSNNTYLPEEAWRCLSSAHGIGEQHKLCRKRRSTKVTSMAIVIAFLYNKPSYIKRKCGTEQRFLMSMEGWESSCRYLMVDKQEEYDYIHCQIRMMYGVAPERESRLLKAEGLRLPRNSALSAHGHATKRQMRQVFKLRPVFGTTVEEEGLDDWDEHFLLDDQLFLFLELREPGQAWASGIPGLPAAQLNRFNGVTGNLVQSGGYQAISASALDLAGEAARSAEAIAQSVRFELETAIHDTLIQVQQRSETLEVRQKKLEFANHELKEREKDFRQREEAVKAREQELEERAKGLDEAIYQLDLERDKFKRSVEEIRDLNKVKDSMIRLRVGDHVYTTSTLTLTRDPDSMLSAMFSGRHALEKDSEGCYFIDRDGTYFRHILNFLRDGGASSSVLPPDRQVLQELLNEAEYYMIQSLVAALRILLDGSRQ